MNLLCISGTPRINGNSEILLKHSMKAFIEKKENTKLLILRDMNIRPCTACDDCKRLGKCTINDDMKDIYELFRWCDALILSSPVYSRNICSQLMAVLDRHYGVNIDRPLKGKVGGGIAVGAGTCGGQTIALNAMYTWMLSCGMICVPGELNGVTATASEPGDILKQDKRLKQAEILGENIYYVTKKLRC
ncbi:multimeric flavodoxin WrbA [Sporomusaceae bacterium BoRhaA]|uniref:flavodoxin family protein n=1 Tax=Pelorhabdus rhamnosifermentans TaxID=2772457 RepID=UPI001C060314|nr:flavodoxin family protein [Pelorhabdus rhamnosifermentans]MBU2703933.1 multimeric flavodoxin WrbA [Pelorhabdus rhamnosifermentans]